MSECEYRGWRIIPTVKSNIVNLDNGYWLWSHTDTGRFHVRTTEETRGLVFSMKNDFSSVDKAKEMIDYYMKFPSEPVRSEREISKAKRLGL